MSKRKLLLADDSVTIQKVVNLTFANEDIEVISVVDGDSAMRKFVEHTPDLVLLDVNLPGLDGYQICEIIKNDAESKHTPVVMLVGSFEPFDEAKARQAGADDFLTKPFQSIRQLVNTVSNLLDPTKTEEKSQLPIENVDLASELFDAGFEDESADEYDSAEASIENLGQSELDDGLIETSPNFGFDEEKVNNFESSAVVENNPVYESFAEDIDRVYVEIPNETTETLVETKPETFVEEVKEIEQEKEIEEDEDEITPVSEERKQPPILNFDDFDLLEFPSQKLTNPTSTRSQQPSDSSSSERKNINASSRKFGENAEDFSTIENLSPEMIEAIAEKVAEKLSSKVIKKIVRETIAQLEKKK